ncbi:hypothetical protein PR202_gb10536 [Eleusine coracana subsp. coracana]|uniref:Ubiquitin-like domain-containing protein n=1 Tax=Eleusine coracana subsp. coracana TaxID=191504 RepID=A0AAV5EKL9_ELECO|nr:hypothetical protein QOZ80_3BG0256580 [Eleusine coracana subsp. coracana]GJN22927.1 hypothetical protein PR202_gb10536 [Eleusine coracana subsp. coracana]
MMRIMVRTLRGERVALDVDAATTTVAQLKSMVAARERVPAEMQRLFFAGRLLDDDDDAPVARFGVQDGSVVFLSLRLRDDDALPQKEPEMRNVQMPQPEPVTVKQEESQQHPVHVHDDGEGISKKRKPVSRRSVRKILSRLHVDVWTSQHDAKFIDLLLRHATRINAGVGDLTAEEWSCIRAELNAATRSAFSVEELQRRLAELRREFDAVSRIRSHPSFGYDARRRVVVAGEAEWKRYVLENPEAAAFEGRRSTHLGRLRAIFAGNGAEPRGHGGAKCRESRVKRCLGKLLRSFGLRCKF